MITPASPWIGSTRKPTVLRRDRGFQGVGIAERHHLEAGREGAEAGARRGSVEKPTIGMVRPWKLSAQTMISAWFLGTPLTS